MSEVVLVGCGNMGFTMLEGWVKLGDGSGFHVVEPNEALRARAGAAGAKVYECADDLPSEFSPDLIFLAVKPPVMDQIVPDCAGRCRIDLGANREPHFPARDHGQRGRDCGG